MAISKILHMKDCGGSFHGKHLKSALEYITAAEKTQNGRLVAAVNCQPDMAFEQMKETKRMFNKPDKRQAYHIILSFKEGEADPDTVFELTGKFVKEYLAGKYEAVYAVRDNTGHPHAHIVFNSVSFVDGKKYRYKKGDWERYIQPITNRLCEEYGLSTIELDEERGKSQSKDREWNRYRDGRFIWSDMVKRDVDTCILQAASFEGFLSRLEEKGYEIKNAHGEGKYIAVKPPGMKRMIRLKTLGDEYSEECIRKRIPEENIKQYAADEKPRIVYCRIKRYKRAKLSGFQKKYYAKLYHTGKLKKKPYSVVWKYRDEIKKMHRLQQQYKFLVNYCINSVEDLQVVIAGLTDKKKEASAQKSRVYRANHKNRDLYDIAEQMDELIHCEQAYMAGDAYFEEEHTEYQRLAAKLGEMGYSYEEVMLLKEHYHSETIKCRDMETAVTREIRLADSIRNDYVADASIIRTEEIKETKQREEHVEQPII